MASESFQVVVYGGGLPGVFAAAKASGEFSDAAGKVALIVPYPKTRYKNASGIWVEEALLGGTMTTGGLNYWDDAKHPENTGDFVQKGSYVYFRNKLDHGFSTTDLSKELVESLRKRNVQVYYNQDIISYTTSSSPYGVASVTISPIHRDSSGNIVWSDLSQKTVLSGRVFIDASEEAKLARRVNTACTVGRYDWPAKYLEADEKDPTDGSKPDYIGRQQACTLMFKMKNIAPTTQKTNYKATAYSSKAACLWSPTGPYTNPNGPVAAFNNAHKDTDGIMIKGPNAGRDGRDSEEWWINSLLIFNVDGRANYRDEAANNTFKVSRKFGSMTTDQAWIKAKNFLKIYKSQIEAALQTFDGFGATSSKPAATIVTDDRGDPVVGDILYVRETVHMSLDSTKRANNSEGNYHVRSGETKDASSGPPPSPSYDKDYGNYPTRIGLAKYGCDLHPCLPKHMLNSQGQYIWGKDMYKNIRADAVVDIVNPVYIPYEAIKTGYVANLLIPGYAAGVCSYSWGEVRVFSNLSVLGDAAGIAAGYCCNNNVNPFSLATQTTHMQAVQAKIKAANGRLEK